MKELNVYLSFAGNCREAVEFYAAALEGEVMDLQTYGESNTETPEDQKDLVMHCLVKAGPVVFMASDAMHEHKPVFGNNVSLSLNFDSEASQTAVFERLAEGGTVTMPLQDTFWNARFGMLTDRFGIHWMFNYDK